MVSVGMDDGFLYSCDMCNFKTIRKDIHTLHIVKHKEEYNNMKQKHSMCKPIVDFDEVQYQILVTKILFHIYTHIYVHLF